MSVAALATALRRRWGVFVAVLLAGLGIIALLDRGGAVPPTYAAEARLRMSDPPEAVSRTVALLAAHLSLAFPEGRPTGDGKEDAGALKRAEEQLKDEAVRRRMLEKVLASVTVGPAPGGAFVRAVAPERGDAVRFANAAAHALSADAANRREARAAALEERAKALRDRLDEEPQDERLQDRERRRAALSASAVQVEKRIEDSLARQDRTVARIRSLEAAEHRLRESVPSGPEEDGLKSAVLDRLRSEMNAIRSEIALRRLSRTPDHDDYRRFTARLAELDEEHRAELYRVRGRTIVELRGEVDRIEEERRLLDERRMRHSLELHELGEEIREGAEKRDALGALRKELDDSVRERRGVALLKPVEVEDAAAAAVSGGNGSSPLWPLGGAVAALLAVGAAWAANRSDPRVRTDADVKRRLDLPTLALVPASSQPLVLRAHPADPLSEAYSAAAAVLRGYLKERDLKVVAVTSARDGDGKSTAAANLAVALARKGMNVAVVDGDLRAPRLHEIFGVENTQGLSTALLGGEVDPELAAGATELAGLRLLPTGPVADLPPELLESGRAREVLRTLRERYDAVIVDAPPVGMSGDAATLARLADTVVWVIRSGASTGGELGWTRQLLRNLRADVAGAILTFAPGSGERRSYAFPMESARA